VKITWLGHAAFRIEIGGRVLLVDPWLRGNPSFDEARFDEAVAGATDILLTHGHGDHASTTAEIAKATGAQVVGIYDLIAWLGATAGLAGVGFNKGGTVMLGDVAVTMVNAVHSSSAGEGPPACVGSEAGYVLTAEGTSVYLAGDTDVHSDMALVRELHQPRIGILPIGGWFTMDAKRAAFACRRFFAFEAVIPSHYGSFGVLAPDAREFESLVAPLPVRCTTPMVAETF
jgi:L-ascorbate metabolism protein UlaG (beta-lactamase superfamily)